LHQSIQLTGRSLIESNFFGHAGSPNSIQHTKHSDTITVCCVFGHIKGNFHVTHGTQVVDFIRLCRRDDANQVGCVAQVPIMQKQLDSSLMTIFVNVINTTSVEARGAADDTVDL
jgi:hypothetical protein